MKAPAYAARDRRDRCAGGSIGIVSRVLYGVAAALVAVVMTGCAHANQRAAAAAPRVADSDFWMVTVSLAGSTALDGAATMSMQKRGCVEQDPLFGGPHPSARRVGWEMGLGTAATVGATYALKRHHDHLWAFPALLLTTLHTGGALQDTFCGGQ